MNNQQSRRGQTQAVAHKTKNNTYRLGVSPTEVSSENENVQRNARKLPGSHPTYKGYSAPSSYRLGVSPTEVARENENVQRNARKLSGLHPTYKGSSARSVTPQGRYAGYSGRIGFTLIELLVVVLIIGILAAVAVPQYQNAVRKAQGREGHAVIDALDKALADYYLEHGSYLQLQAGTSVFVYEPVDTERLNIEIPTLKHFYFRQNDGTLSSSLPKMQIGTDGYACMNLQKTNTGIQVGTNPSSSIEVRACWKDGSLQSALCWPAEACSKYFNGEEIQVGTVRIK